MFTSNEPMEIGNLLDALQQSSKGQLQYDSNWKDEGRTKEIVDSIKENLTCLRLTHRFRQLGQLLIQEQIANGDSRSSSTSPPLLISVPLNISNSSNDSQNGDGSSTSVNQNTSITIDANDLEDYRIESQLKEYDRELRKTSQKRVSELASKLREQRKLLDRSLTDEWKSIEKESQHRSLLLQQRHEEQLRLQEQEDLLELQKSTSNRTSTLRSSARIAAGNRLKTQNETEKQKIVEETEEQKQKQTELRSKMNSCKDSIQQIFQECSRFITDIKKLLPPGTLATEELEQYRKSLTALIMAIHQLLATSGQRSLIDEDLKLAENNRMEAIRIKTRLQMLLDKLQKISLQIAQKKASEAAAAAATAAATSTIQTHPDPIPKSSPKPKSITTKIVDTPRERYYRSQTDLLKFEQQCEIFSENVSMKEKKNNLNLFIRSTINKICNLSVEHLKTQLQKLLHLFEGKTLNKEKRGGTRISCSSNDNSLQFAINCASKAFINVACQNKSIAFQLAPVISVLWSFHPEFGRIFMCQLCKSCPYVVPYYPDQDQQQQETEAEYLEMCGYKFGKNGELETEEQFHGRMFKLIELYSAIVQCNHSHDISHPQDLHLGWQWLATVLNQEPRHAITALMLEAFLSVSAHKLHASYGRQFVKLLEFIRKIYVVKLEKITKSDDRQTFMRFISMMDTFGRKISSSNRTLPPPDGLVPNYFFTKSYIFSTR